MIDKQSFAFRVSAFTTSATNLATILKLFPMSDNEFMKPFRLARLCDCKGDLSKRWFVEFYAWDEQKAKLVRKRYYQINNYKSEVERRAAAKILIKDITTTQLSRINVALKNQQM